MTEKTVSYKANEKTKYPLINASLSFAKTLNEIHPYKPSELLQNSLATSCKTFLAEVNKVKLSKNSRLYTIVLETTPYMHAVGKKLSSNGVISTSAKFTLRELVDHANRILNLKAEMDAFCLSLTQSLPEAAEAAEAVEEAITAKTLESEIFS